MKLSKSYLEILTALSEKVEKLEANDKLHCDWIQESRHHVENINVEVQDQFLNKVRKVLDQTLAETYAQSKVLMTANANADIKSVFVDSTGVGVNPEIYFEIILDKLLSKLHSNSPALEITKNDTQILFTLMGGGGVSPDVDNILALLEAGDNITIAKNLLETKIKVSGTGTSTPITIDTLKQFFDLTDPNTPNVTGDYDVVNGKFQNDHRYRNLKAIPATRQLPSNPIYLKYHENDGETDGKYYLDPPEDNPIRDYVVSVWHPQIAITQVAKDSQGYFIFQDSSFLGQQMWSHFNQIKRSTDPVISSPQGAQTFIDNLGTNKIYLDIYQRKGTAGTGQPAFKYMWSPSLNIDVAPAGSTDNTCLIANATYQAEVLKRGTTAGVYEYETRTYTFSFYLNNHTMFFRFKNDQGNEFKTFDTTFAFRLRRDNTQYLTTRMKSKVKSTPKQTKVLKTKRVKEGIVSKFKKMYNKLASNKINKSLLIRPWKKKIDKK